MSKLNYSKDFNDVRKKAIGGRPPSVKILKRRSVIEFLPSDGTYIGRNKLFEKCKQDNIGTAKASKELKILVFDDAIKKVTPKKKRTKGEEGVRYRLKCAEPIPFNQPLRIEFGKKELQKKWVLWLDALLERINELKKEGLSESALLDRLGRETNLSKDLLKFLIKEKAKKK